jgi:hypothetical protein
MELRQAEGLRTDMYKLFGFLRNAPRIEPGYDPVATRYAAIATNVKMRVLQDELPEVTWRLHWELNPLVTLTAMQKELAG